MILELHEKKLNPIPAEPIKPDKYYAVDDINNYYFGRVLEVKSNGFIKFKFWHSAGRNKRDWSRRDDIDEVHVSCIFYGPVHLEGNRPFVITGHEEVEKVFLAAKNVLYILYLKFGFCFVYSACVFDILAVKETFV